MVASSPTDQTLRLTLSPVIACDPRLLDWLGGAVKKGFEGSECGAVTRGTESHMARNWEIQKEWQAWER